MPLTSLWRTRPETDTDRDEVYALTAAAFGRAEEAALVEALRADPEAWIPELSYVAEGPDGSVVAYALITRCHVDEVPALALAPVAVRPEWQRQGAGAAVVRAVLETARGRTERLVLVLGHPRSTTRASVSYMPPSTVSGPDSTHRTRRWWRSSWTAPRP